MYINSEIFLEINRGKITLSCKLWCVQRMLCSRYMKIRGSVLSGFFWVKMGLQSLVEVCFVYTFYVLLYHFILNPNKSYISKQE